MQSRADIHPVILCGGSGTRLWPVSRKSYPKQFSTLLGDESLFQSCAKRLAGKGYASPIVLTGDPFRFIVTDQLSEVGIEAQAIMIEPEARNTAPAILASALWLAEKSPDALILVAPADHVIATPEAFRDAVEKARPAAEQGRLVTFGIKPTRPETGYGYLEIGEDGLTEDRPMDLSRFVEKPDASSAASMIASGKFLWNAGIFLFSAKAIVEAYQAHAPDMVSAVAASLVDAKADLGFIRLANAHWSKVEPISIDYAIMEKAGNLAVMPYAAAWNDLGAWEAVWREQNPDSDGNVCTGHATAIGCRDSLLRSESENLEVVGIGLEDIIAIATPDAVLVAPKSQAQRVKDAVDALKAKGARQATDFPKDHRPWGWFESIASGDRFQVKRIVVQPGASLSLQSHVHRAEHWIVVAGTAKVTVDDVITLLTENQSVYIPLGSVHRLENPGKVPMTLIEVQTGSYLGEDDITRYDDRYSRS